MTLFTTSAISAKSLSAVKFRPKNGAITNLVALSELRTDKLFRLPISCFVSLEDSDVLSPPKGKLELFQMALAKADNNFWLKLVD